MTVPVRSSASLRGAREGLADAGWQYDAEVGRVLFLGQLERSAPREGLGDARSSFDKKAKEEASRMEPTGPTLLVPRRENQGLWSHALSAASIRESFHPLTPSLPS